MMQNDLGMVRHWIHPLKSGCRIEARTANVALESTGAEDLLQFVQPRQLQGQRMLGVLLSITVSAKRSRILCTSARVQENRLAIDRTLSPQITSLDNILAVKDLAHLGSRRRVDNHTCRQNQGRSTPLGSVRWEPYHERALAARGLD